MSIQRRSSDFDDWKMRSMLTTQRDEVLFILAGILFTTLAAAVLIWM